MASNDTVTIMIRFESTNVYKELTRAKFEWSIFLSNIGGQLGLFMGFSLLSALEIAELFYDVFTTLALRVLFRARSHIGSTHVVT